MGHNNKEHAAARHSDHDVAVVVYAVRWRCARYASKRPTCATASGSLKSLAKTETSGETQSGNGVV
jgi:hypothetical protein